MTAATAETWTDDEGWNHAVAAPNGVELHYVTAGPADGTPVVMLHGFPECWWAWHRHIDRLADEFRLIVPDMRGYNRSEKPFEVRRYRLTELSGDVAGLIGAEGYESAHVVGHDWGGFVGFGTALQHPNRIDRLVVLNAPYPGAFRTQLTLKQAVRSWYAGFFQLPAVPERLLAANDFAALERILRDDPEPGTYTDADIERYKRAWRRDGAIRAMIDYYRAFGRENVRRLWRNEWNAGRRVRAETLVLWGERDRALEPHVPNVIQRELERVSVEHYPDASHWIHAERPDATAAEIRAFLSAP